MVQMCPEALRLRLMYEVVLCSNLSRYLTSCEHRELDTNRGDNSVIVTVVAAPRSDFGSQQGLRGQTDQIIDDTRGSVYSCYTPASVTLDKRL